MFKTDSKKCYSAPVQEYSDLLPEFIVCLSPGDVNAPGNTGDDFWDFGGEGEREF